MGKTEPTEISQNWIKGKIASPVSKYRKVTTHKCPCINVLIIEMEPWKGEGDNQTNGQFGRLNQWKICISGFLSADRSPHTNVLNVETEPRMGHGENWTSGKFGKLNQQKICISGF